MFLGLMRKVCRREYGTFKCGEIFSSQFVGRVLFAKDLESPAYRFARLGSMEFGSIPKWLMAS